MFRLAVALCGVLAGLTDPGNPTPPAHEILDRVLANRPAKDFSLKGRLFINRDKEQPVEILVKNCADGTRTIFNGGDTSLLVIQPLRSEARLYLRGTGELTGTHRSDRFLQSSFSYYDLGLPYVHWTNSHLVGQERVRAQDCFVINSTATSGPYARVKLWIHKEYYALLRAEAYDADDNLVKRFAVTSFKRIGDVWMPRGMEMATVPAGQSLPSQDKSRLQIDEGNYDTQLCADEFLPEKFSARQ